MAGYTNEVYTPIYSGILTKAVKPMRELQDAMDKALEDKNYWPCLNNPYFYTDYDGYGFEDEEGRALYKHITSDEAEMLCHGCPLIKQCYDFAVANEEKSGIWGGIDFSINDNTLFPEDVNA